MGIILPLADQRLDLNKLGPNDNDTVRGQIVGKETLNDEKSVHSLFFLVWHLRQWHYM